MALNAQTLKTLFYNRIYAGLQTQFGPEIAGSPSYQPQADKEWGKLAEAISGIAADIVNQIQTSAEVKAGIDVLVQTSTGPATGNTKSPGKIT